MGIRDIVPNDIKPAEQIKIRAAKKVTADKVVYKHVIINAYGSESKPVKWVKKLFKGEVKKLIRPYMLLCYN